MADKIAASFGLRNVSGGSVIIDQHLYDEALRLHGIDEILRQLNDVSVAE